MFLNARRRLLPLSARHTYGYSADAQRLALNLTAHPQQELDLRERVEQLHIQTLAFSLCGFGDWSIGHREAVRGRERRQTIGARSRRQLTMVAAMECHLRLRLETRASGRRREFIRHRRWRASCSAIHAMRRLAAPRGDIAAGQYSACSIARRSMHFSRGLS
jgi:hypothetical protein